MLLLNPLSSLSWANKPLGILTRKSGNDKSIEFTSTLSSKLSKAAKSMMLVSILAGLSACETMPIPSQGPVDSQASKSTTVIQAPSQGTIIIREGEGSSYPASTTIITTTPDSDSTDHYDWSVPPVVSSLPSNSTNTTLPPSSGIITTPSTITHPTPTDVIESNDPLTNSGISSSSVENGTRNPISVTAPVIEPPSSQSTNRTPAATVPTMPAPVLTLPPDSDKSAREALLERARQNSAASSNKSASASSGEDIPAFQQLMKSGVAALQANRLNDAENSFTRAQRIAPRSSAVYFYLSQVALKKNQPRKAEAMARRGLVVTQDASRRRALWQLILRSGQMQNNPRVIAEANAALR